MTEWRPVLGWEGLYEVSDDGQVKSMPRHRRDSEHLMSLQQNPKTRKWFVVLYDKRRMVNERVHNLVLAAFVGPRPPGMFGLHTDDNPDNNHISNLRWGTRSDNSYDMVANGNHNHARKTHCKWGHPFTDARNAKQRICRECHARRNAEYLARRGPKPKTVKQCPACSTEHTRRSKFCSDTCYARAQYRAKVGTPIDAPLHTRVNGNQS